MTRESKRLKMSKDMDGSFNGSGYLDYAVAINLQTELSINSEASSSSQPETWDPDLELARQLQAEWEREIQEPEDSKTEKDAVNFDDDMAMARAMQEEWNAEAAIASVDMLDRDFARKLQDEEDEIYARSRRSALYKAKEAIVIPETDALGLTMLKEEFATPRNCGSCTTPFSILELAKNNSFNMRDTEPFAEVVSIVHTTCPACAMAVCPACLGASCPEDCNFLTGTCISFNHCNTSRILAALQILSTLDQAVISHKTEPETLAEPRKRKAPGNGVGYSSDSSSSESANSADSESVDLAKSYNASSDYDSQLCLLFESLAHILPAPANTFAAEFDYLPHPSLGAIIRSSYLLEVFEELLRNDSVEDMSLRSELYFSMMRILRLFAGHEALFDLLTRKREIIAKTNGVYHYVYNGGSPEKLAETSVVVENTGMKSKIGRIVNRKKTKPVAAVSPAKLQYGPPLLPLFEKLVTQARIFRRTAASNYESLQFDDDEMSTKAVGLCGDLVDLWDIITLSIQDLENSRQTDEDSDKSKGKQPETEVTLKDHLKGLAFAEYDILGPGNTLHPYAYSREVNALGGRSLNPKRTLTLAKELATMSTSLPDGIYVRVQPDRPDVLKALIVGPRDTPYYAGLFEFDIFAPAEYPATPPLFKLKTTGEGRVRFNPNLYNCGKVCLSLLNTWSGSSHEMWQPYKSTLLQCLLSIQAMIFVSRPWYNEPGTGTPSDSTNSKEYNSNICIQKYKYAICGNLTEQMASSMWKDVIALYFTDEEASIRVQLEVDVKNYPQLKNYHKGGNGAGLIARLQTQTKAEDLVVEWDNGIERAREWASQVIA